jgi:hypothetical protein
MQENEFFSVKQVAARIAAHRDVGEAQVARVIRYLSGEDVVSHKLQGGAGVTAPKLWDEPGVHRVAMLVELNRLGLSDDLVRAASFCMNNYAEGYGDGIGDPGPIVGRERADRLLEILPELRHGVNYFYHLYLVPDFFQKPGRVLGGTFSKSSDGGEPHPYVVSTITLGLRHILPLSQG